MNPLTSQLALWALMVPVALGLSKLVAWWMQATPVEDPFADPCICGHVPDLHDHFSPDSHCAGFECGCQRYEPEILAGVGR